MLGATVLNGGLFNSICLSKRVSEFKIVLSIKVFTTISAPSEHPVYRTSIWKPVLTPSEFPDIAGGFDGAEEIACDTRL